MREYSEHPENARSANSVQEIVWNAHIQESVFVPFGEVWRETAQHVPGEFLETGDAQPHALDHAGAHVVDPGHASERVQAAALWNNRRG